MDKMEKPEASSKSNTAESLVEMNRFNNLGLGGRGGLLCHLMIRSFHPPNKAKE
jgi:hypothetical protein